MAEHDDLWWGDWYKFVGGSVDLLHGLLLDFFRRNPDQAYQIAKGLSGKYSMGDTHVYSAADFEKEAKKNVWKAIHDFGPSAEELDGDLPYVIWRENINSAWSCDADELANYLTNSLIGSTDLRGIVGDTEFRAGAGLRAALREARKKGAAATRTPSAKRKSNWTAKGAAKAGKPAAGRSRATGRARR